MRKLVDAGVMDATATQVVATIYGYGGTDLLERQLDLLLDGENCCGGCYPGSPP